VTSKAKFSLFPEGKNESGSAPDAFESLCGRVIEVPKFFRAEVWKSVLLEVSPEIFDRIEFWSVGGKEFDMQALALAGDEVPHQSAAVDGRAIPEDQQFAGHMPQKMSQEINHLWTFDAAGMEGEVVIPPCQPGDGREAFPVEGELQYRRLAARRPGAHPMGFLTQSAFINEDDGAAFASGFFFMAGQRFFFQCSIFFSSRSRARPTGRWQLQRNLARMRQTWSGWYRTPVCSSIRRATRPLVHKAVGYPKACGPALSPTSKAASSSAPKRGLRPARPAFFNPVTPSPWSVAAQRLTDCRWTPTRRATSACGKPFFNNFAASKRRSSIKSKSRRTLLLLVMPDNLPDTRINVTILCRTQ